MAQVPTHMDYGWDLLTDFATSFDSYNLWALSECGTSGSMSFGAAIKWVLAMSNTVSVVFYAIQEMRSLSSTWDPIVV